MLARAKEDAAARNRKLRKLGEMKNCKVAGLDLRVCVEYMRTFSFRKVGDDFGSAAAAAPAAAPRRAATSRLNVQRDVCNDIFAFFAYAFPSFEPAHLCGIR